MNPLSPVNIDVDDVTGISGSWKDPPVSEDGPLDRQSGDEHVQGDAAEPIALQKGHQKTEADEYHPVYVHEDCARKQYCNYCNCSNCN